MYQGERDDNITQFNNAQDHTPSVGFGDAIEGSWDFMNMGTATHYLKNAANINYLEKREKRLDQRLDETPGDHGKIDPEKLNEMYPFMDEPFIEPTSKAVASYLADRQKEKMRYQGIMAAGPQSMPMQLAHFGVGIGAHMTDPVEFLAGMAGGALIEAAAGAIAAGTAVQSASMLGRTASYLAKSPFARTAIGDIAGNLAVEPIMMAGADQLRDTYTTSDFLLSTVVAPIGMSVAKFGFTKAFKGMRYAGGKMMEKVHQTSAMQMALGKQVDVGNLADMAVTRIDNGGEFRYSPVNIDDVNGKSLYIAGDSTDVTGNVTGLDFEGAVHVVDNPNRAAGIAIGEGTSGRISEVKLENANILNASKELDFAEVNDLNGFLKTNGIEGEPVKTAGEALKAIETSGKVAGEISALQTKLADHLYTKGYDGLAVKPEIMTGKRLASEDANAIAVFPQAYEKVKQGNRTIVQKSSKARAEEYISTKAERERVESETSDIFYDDDAAKAYDSMETAKQGSEATTTAKETAGGALEAEDIDVNRRTKELQMDAERSMSKLKDLEEQGTIVEELKPLAEDIKQAKTDIQTESELTKAAISCMR